MKRYVFLGFLVLFVGIGVFAQTIDKVVQSGINFTVHNSNGQTASWSGSGCALVGWGSDFFVLKQSTNTILTIDIKGNRIATKGESFFEGSSIRAGGNTISVTKGSETRIYDKNLNRR